MVSGSELFVKYLWVLVQEMLLDVAFDVTPKQAVLTPEGLLLGMNSKVVFVVSGVVGRVVAETAIKLGTLRCRV